ncbi:MAG: hypothetical protein Q8J69_02470 [Sphingobacteriaceae bacterium]|nr:hypothetical protein [Sphingobacteriaceae bacterium]
MIFCLGLSPALAQVDAYDEYLNGKKRGQKSPSGDKKAFNYRERYLAELGASFYWFDVNTIYGPATITMPGVNYVARLVLNQYPDKYSLSIGTHPSLGLQFGNFASYFMLSVPVMLEGTIGMGSSIYNESRIGAFVGLGPEYNIARSWGDFALPVRIDQVAAVAAVGLRFRIRERGYYLRYSEAFWAPVQGQYFRTIAFGNSLF